MTVTTEAHELAALRRRHDVEELPGFNVHAPVASHLVDVRVLPVRPLGGVDHAALVERETAELTAGLPVYGERPPIREKPNHQQEQRESGEDGERAAFHQRLRATSARRGS